MKRRVLSIAVLILFAQRVSGRPTVRIGIGIRSGAGGRAAWARACVVHRRVSERRSSRRVVRERPRTPAPYFNEQKDKSADVRVGGSRRQPGAKEWERLVMSDTFGVSDNNPCMAIDKQGRLWLFHATLLGVPDWSWGSCILRFMVASRYDHPGRPTWDKSNVLVPQVTGFDDVLQTALDARKADGWPDEKINQARQYVKLATGRPLATRVGWMPRAHPIVRNDGAVLVPLANENSLAACMAITNDNGETWTFSKFVPDLGLEQPSVVQYPDGTMTAFFRNDSDRIKRSESTDGGMTWGTVTRTDRPHPNSGIEVVLLANGKLLLIYNDEEDERDSLAVSLSDDRGKTWRWTRHLRSAKGAARLSVGCAGERREHSRDLQRTRRQ